MASYADYTYYINTFLGDAIAETDFPRLALQASQVIDRVTFQRAADEIVVATINKIKMAMCAVADELQKQESNDSADGVASESQGQYSISYAANSNRMKSNQSKLETAAMLWLDGTALMFAGFNSGEYGWTWNDTQ